MNPIVKIYINLLEEGTDTIRPTQAEALGNELYKVLPTPRYNPENETWEFLPGSLVKVVKSKAHDGEDILLAIEQVKANLK